MKKRQQRYDRTQKGQARWRKYNASKRGRARHVRYKLAQYGLTQERYDKMLVRCGGRCEVCGKPFHGSQEPHIDHDHRTKKVRGLLCLLCNRALERLDNVPGWTWRASRYARRGVWKPRS